MSSAVGIGTFLLGGFFVIQVVGVATEYWMTVEHSSGIAESHGGLFRLCYEVLTIEKCFYYVSYAEDFLNIHYLGITGSSLLGCLLLFIAALVGLCGCSKPNPKPTVQNLSGVGVFGGFFASVGALWYYLYFFKGTFGDVAVLLTAFGVDVGPGWSFYLCAVAGGGSLLVSTILMIIGCNMPVANGAVLPNQQPQTVIAISGNGMHQAPQHHPQPVFAMQNASYADPFAPQQSNSHSNFPSQYSADTKQKV